MTSMHPFDCIEKEEVGDTFALLYSGMQSQGSGERSLLAFGPQTEIKSGTFEDLPNAHLFGYAGYEMLHGLEDVPQGEPSPIALPAQWWFQPGEVRTLPAAPAPECNVDISGIAELKSNLSTKRYLQIVRDTVEQIRAGAFYQANITRKFYGRFESAPDPFILFKKLCSLSPSPYSAYLQFGEVAILSSSPEGFLQIDETGRVVARPIKGSAPPGDGTLERSDKDRAENLMIVDLMRNDLSRVCHNVNTEALFELHDFATIRQMISTISGQRRAELLGVIKAAFPPGSMTGAPKVAAMRWIAKQEQMQRGVYSGALGWLNTANQTADLSVVIRTLIIQGDRFEFQVGGGIVADSVPEKELEETLLKARAMCQLLGLSSEALREC